LNKIFEDLNGQKQKDPFDEYLKTKRDAQDEFFETEKGNFKSFKLDEDPLHTKSNSSFNYGHMFQNARQKTEEIKKNWDEAQFLADYGRPDRPMAVVKVCDFLTN